MHNYINISPAPNYLSATMPENNHAEAKMNDSRVAHD